MSSILLYVLYSFYKDLMIIGFFFFFSISHVLYMNKNIRKLQILNKDDLPNLYHRKLTLVFDV